MPLEGVLDLFFWAGATVHPNYDGRHSWSAAVLLGRVSDPLAAVDLETAGRLTLERLSQTFFGRHKTTMGKVTWSDHSVDGHPGLLFSARVHYAVKRLPSRYDTVTAMLVRLDDGSLVLAAHRCAERRRPGGGAAGRGLAGHARASADGGPRSARRVWVAATHSASLAWAAPLSTAARARPSWSAKRGKQSVQAAAWRRRPARRRH